MTHLRQASGGLVVRDWRDVDAGVMRDLHAREERRWRQALSWETASSSESIEYARTTWGLPGVVVADAEGPIRGWAFWLIEDGLVKVGGFVAEHEAATRALLHSILDRADAAAVDGLSLFVYDHAPGLRRALYGAGFDIAPFLYLSRNIAQPPAAVPAIHRENDTMRGWLPEDEAAAARLMAEAYGEGGLHFAPHNRPEQWARYVSNLVGQTAVGALMPDASRVLRADDRMAALVVMTRIAPTTAHVAQVVVHPVWRGRKLASALVGAACTRAAEQGCTRATLLVAAANRPARTVYARMGFDVTATFVAARRRLDSRECLIAS
jgi:ribosomal protein S18 acetylase RimI-like enzyme